MNALLDVPMWEFEPYVKRYRELWEEYHGLPLTTHQGAQPNIGLIMHLLLAETDAEVVAQAMTSGSPDAGQRRQNSGGLSTTSIAASPESMREFVDECIATGANYFVCSFQWCDLSHEQAMRSIELFIRAVMPHYVDASAP